MLRARTNRTLTSTALLICTLLCAPLAFPEIVKGQESKADTNIFRQVTPLPALQEVNGKLYQPIKIEVQSKQQAGPAEVRIEGAEPVEIGMGDQSSTAVVLVPETDQPRTLSATLWADGNKLESAKFEQIPVRKWQVDFIQHTHTDIGYTHPQSDILSKHLRNIDDALDMCDFTDDWPEESKFRWTCELTWAVREYLERRPQAQIDRLKQRIAEGRIEVAGMMLNMAEIATEDALAAPFLIPVRRIEWATGARIEMAMQNDVNGIAWCMPDYFSGLGIKYLNMGINKTRSLLPFPQVQTAFWWESPSGNRVLAFRADHYMRGNKLMIHRGEADVFADRVLGYLVEMGRAGYAFDRIPIQYSGYRTDNSSANLVPCEMIRSFNETYAWPKLRSATISEFHRWVEKNHGDDLPVHRQAWSDWWTDGFASAALETAASRKHHVMLRQANTMLAMASLSGNRPEKGVAQRNLAAQENLLFYDEHTFGADESIDNPTSLLTQIQWGQKSGFVWNAAVQTMMLVEEAEGQLQKFAPQLKEQHSLAVFNTMNWQRSGPIAVDIEHNILPPDGRNRLIDVSTGEEVPIQLVLWDNTTYRWVFWAEDVPALGYRVYRIEPRPNFDIRYKPIFHEDSFMLQGYYTEDLKKEIMSTVPAEQAVESLENEYYSLETDPATGAIISLVDKQTGRQLVDDQSKWKMGQLIHERMTHKNRYDIRREFFETSTVRNVKLHPGVDGPVWRSIVYTAEMDGCVGPEGVRCEYKLYKTGKLIELEYTIQKSHDTDPEAIYVAFPFDGDQRKIIYEAQGAPVELPEGILPGSSSDWQTAQNFVAARDDKGQVIWSALGVPLIQVGDLNMGKWMADMEVERPHIYSWVMNNYWFTNFKASQPGEFAWQYALTSTEDTSNAAATRFGWGWRAPLVARLRRPGPPSDRPTAGSLIELPGKSLLLVEARPSMFDDSVILHLREVNGQPAEIDLTDLTEQLDLRTVYEVNVVEETIHQDTARLHFEPYQVRFLKLIQKPIHKGPKGG